MEISEVDKNGMREVAMSELKEIMRDPFRVLVFEPLTGDAFISTYGSGTYDLIEKSTSKITML